MHFAFQLLESEPTRAKLNFIQLVLWSLCFSSKCAVCVSEMLRGWGGCMKSESREGNVMIV